MDRLVGQGAGIAQDRCRKSPLSASAMAEAILVDHRHGVAADFLGI